MPTFAKQTLSAHQVRSAQQEPHSDDSVKMCNESSRYQKEMQLYLF